MCIIKHPNIWESTLWTYETKMEVFGIRVSHCMCFKSNITFPKQNIITTAKYSGGSVVACCCCAASGPR